MVMGPAPSSQEENCVLGGVRRLDDLDDQPLAEASPSPSTTTSAVEASTGVAGNSTVGWSEASPETVGMSAGRSDTGVPEIGAERVDEIDDEDQRGSGLDTEPSGGVSA